MTNILLFICTINGTDSRPRNETTATTANASIGSSTISVESNSTRFPNADAIEAHAIVKPVDEKTQSLIGRIDINCGCVFITETKCGGQWKFLKPGGHYTKGWENSFFERTFPLFHMTEDEKESAKKIFEPFNFENSFEFSEPEAIKLSKVLLFLHKLCIETDPSKIQSVCESDYWLKPASNIYNCRKRLDSLANQYYSGGFDLLENNIDGFTIYKLIERIIKQIDLDINKCLDKILSEDQKADVASAYAEALNNASIYDVLAKDRRKYPPKFLKKRKRRKRNIQFTATNYQKAKIGNQGALGQKINKQLDPDVKTRINRVLQEERSGRSGVIQ